MQSQLLEPFLNMKTGNVFVARVNHVQGDRVAIAFDNQVVAVETEVPLSEGQVVTLVYRGHDARRDKATLQVLPDPKIGASRLPAVREQLIEEAFRQFQVPAAKEVVAQVRQALMTQRADQGLQAMADKLDGLMVLLKAGLPLDTATSKLWQRFMDSPDLARIIGDLPRQEPVVARLVPTIPPPEGASAAPTEVGKTPVETPPPEGGNLQPDGQLGQTNREEPRSALPPNPGGGSTTSDIRPEVSKTAPDNITPQPRPVVSSAPPDIRPGVSSTQPSIGSEVSGTNPDSRSQESESTLPPRPDVENDGLEQRPELAQVRPDMNMPQALPVDVRGAVTSRDQLVLQLFHQLAGEEFLSTSPDRGEPQQASSGRLPELGEQTRMLVQELGLELAQTLALRNQGSEGLYIQLPFFAAEQLFAAELLIVPEESGSREDQEQPFQIALQVTTEWLGTVFVRIVASQQTLQLELAGETDTTVQELTDHLDELETALTSQGWHVASLQARRRRPDDSCRHMYMQRLKTGSIRHIDIRA